MRHDERAMILAPLLAFVAAAAPARAQTLERRPYLQSVTPSSAIVVWTTDTAVDGVVRYGADPAKLTQQAQHGDARTQHEVRIDGLSAGTRYYYSVGTASGVLAGGDSTHFLETSPPPGTPEKFRAWIVGDSGTGDGRQAQVRDAMLAFAGAHRPELFLHVGDMAYNTGTTTEFTNHFFVPYEAVLRNTVVWPAMGNHEGISSDSGTQTGPYYTAYVLPRSAEAGGLASGTEAYYSFDHANVHFVVLDSHDSPRTPGGAMLTWLQADLMATDQPWLVAYWHHPAYTKGSHNSDTELPLIEMRENALPILEAAGVDLVLAGHSHIYERSYLLDGAYGTPTAATGHILDSGDGKPLGSGPYRKQGGIHAHDGAVYVVAGHGGARVSGRGDHPVMYFSELENGSCLLDVQDNRLSLVNIRRDGAVTDRFAMVKGSGLVLAAPDGGEALLAGDTFDIRWATAGDIPSVKLEVSIDDGRRWQTIADAAPNTGSYTWTVPRVETKAALLRVSEAGRPAVNDESNAGFAISSSGPVQAILFGDAWSYNDEGVDLGTAWRERGYDDSGWPSGPGQLGYGDGDEATVLRQSMPAAPSVYFRRVVQLDAPVVEASLRVLHDDGVAIWINGAEVLGRHVDEGTEHARFASATSQDNELSSGAIAMSPGPFVVGDNVVAVMVKQRDAMSSDLSFDLELTVRLLAAEGSGGVGGGAQNTDVGAGEWSSGAGTELKGDAGLCGVGTVGERRSSLALAGLGALAALVARRRRRANRAARRSGYGSLQM